MSFPYCVGRSDIQGVGIIATQFIAKGTRVPMPDLHPILDQWGKLVYCPGFNNSCHPNISEREDRNARLALRDIQVGEELTVSYGWVMSDCNCEVCRGKR